MSEFLETWSLKAMGWVGLILLAFPVLYVVAQAASQRRPLLSWPARIGAFFAAAYVTVPVAEGVFEVRFPGLREGDYASAIYAAAIGSVIALACAIAIKSKLESARTSGTGDAGVSRRWPTASTPAEVGQRRSQTVTTSSLPGRQHRAAPVTNDGTVTAVREWSYEERVRAIRERVSAGELRIVHASARPLGDNTARMLEAAQDRREFGAVLERNQTWWYNHKAGETQIHVEIALHNSTDRPVRSLVLEVWDRTLPGPPLVTLRFQLSLEQPVPAGAEAVARTKLSLPTRHPALQGSMVNLVITAASPSLD